MGHSMVGGGGGGAVREVATSFPVRCLGAIRTSKKFWKVLKEEDEESSKTLKIFEKRKKDFPKIQPNCHFINTEVSTFASSKGTQAVVSI